jgi:4'-phosphopantetheinyl transferase
MSVSCLTQDAADVPADLTWLAPGERERLAGFHVPARRRDWLLGRWTAKRALGARLGAPAAPMPPERIEIRAAEDGAPEPFVDGAPAPWTISLSHRAGRALCAVAPGAAILGCDLERIEPRDAALVADFFAPSEQAVARAAAPADRERLVALLWSAKESALKALRTGLREDPRDVVVTPHTPPPGAVWRPLTVVHAPSGRRFAGWWRDAGGWVLTVIAPAPPA